VAAGEREGAEGGGGGRRGRMGAVAAYREGAEERAGRARAGLEALVGDLGALAERLGAKTPQEAREALLAQVDRGSVEGLKANAPLAEALGAVQDLLAQMVSYLRDVELWAQLQVPPVSDGNNFGVEVQASCIGLVQDRRQKARLAFETLSEWHWQRGNAIEKFASQTVEDAGGAKTSRKTYDYVEDFRMFVVGLDVKAQFDALDACRRAMADIAVCLDTLEKNQEKVEHPRGTGSNVALMY